MVTTLRFGRLHCSAFIYGKSTGERSVGAVLVRRWHGCGCVGSAPGMSWRGGLRSGGRQKGAQKKGLWTHPRTAMVMLDETIITETPPLYCCYGHIGQQVRVPISGRRAKRVVHGAINILTGDVLLLITDLWNEVTHQFFLQMVRSHWRGWHIILFEDRGSPHTAEDSLELARALGVQVRLLPTACPELNAMDHLFRFVKGRGVSNHPTRSIDASALAACRYIYALPWYERLAKAGVLSDDFWLLPKSEL